LSDTNRPSSGRPSPASHSSCHGISFVECSILQASLPPIVGAPHGRAQSPGLLKSRGR
jgi:hypothetical protein